MKKRFFPLFLVLALLSTLLPQVALPASAATYSGYCGAEGDGSNLTWTLDTETGLLTIDGSGAMKDYATVPPWINFSSTITSISLPDGLTNIGSSAFRNIECLTTVIIPNSVTYIGSYAFYFCGSLTNVTIGNSVTRIGGFAFSECNSLTSIAIPECVSSLDYSFTGCTRLTDIHVHSGNMFFCSVNGVLYNKAQTELLRHPSGKQNETYTIPDGVESISSYAFYGCNSLKNVTIPESVTGIGRSSFQGCTSLTSVVIPNNVMSIGDAAFAQCISLTKVVLPNKLRMISNSMFSNCCSLTNIMIPDSVISVASYAFHECSSLNVITIPYSVEDIGQYAFKKCDSLVSIAVYNPICHIFPDWYTLGVPGVTTVYGYMGSSSETHAKTYGYPFVPITSYETEWSISSLYAINEYLPITVYQNARNPQDQEESLIAAKKAGVLYDAVSYETDDTGFVKFQYDGGSITVSKNGYVSRSFTEAQLKNEPKIVLQKQSNYPVISGLWMNDQDVLHQECKVSLTGTEQYTLTTEIDWGPGSKGSVKLMQGGASVDLTNGSVDLIWSDQFDVNEEVLLVATNAAGLTSKKRLLISSESFFPSGLEGFQIEFGDSLSFTLPDSVPEFFRGTELSAGIYSNIPIEYTIENGKVYAAIGFQKDYSHSDGKAKAKTFAQSLKDVLKDAADGLNDYHVDQAVMRELGGYAAVVEGSFGVKTGFKIMGYAEGYLTSEGKVVWLDSGLIVGGNASVGYSFPFYLGPVPMFFEAKLAGSVEAKANLYIAPEAKTFTPNLKLTGDISLNAGLGVGISKVASLSGGLKGSLTPRWDISFGKTNYFQLKAKLKAYAKIALLCFEYSKDWTLTEATWYEYPERKLLQANEDTDLAFAPYDTENYCLQDLSYLANGSAFCANQSAVRSIKQSVWLSNAYAQASPQLVTFSDGTMLAAWIGMDESGTANGLRLFASYYDGEVWSEPQQVDPDGTMDASPVMTVIDDVAYLAWQNASADVSDISELSALAGMMDLSLAVFDRENQSFQIQRLTENNGLLDMAPVICGSGSNIYAVWQRNTDNEWFGTEHNCIVYRSMSDGVWDDEVAAYTDLGSIASMDADFDGNSLQIAYSVDTDGDLNTLSDLELYENGTQLTENEAVDSGAKYFAHELYWYKDGSIVTNDGTILENVPTDRFQIVSDDAVTAIVYAEQDGLTSTLFAAYYDATSEAWGNPIALTDGETNAASFSAAVVDGSVTVLWNSVEVDDDFDSENPYGTANLRMTENTLECDLAITDVSYDCSEYVVGSNMTLVINVQNNGELTANGVNVVITDTAGNELSNGNYADVVLSGGSNEITCGFPADAEHYGQTLTITVLPRSLDDSNVGDNSSNIEISFRDIAVENMSYARTEEGNVVIFADVVNRSYEDTDGTITVGIYKDNLESEPLDTMTISGLDSLNLAHAAFVVNGTESAVYFIAIQAESGNEKLGNDEDFVFVDTSYACNPFEDVAENDFFFNPVMWAVNHNPQVTAGIDETHFGPNNDCTREQIVTFLWAANGKPEPEGTGTAFSDVASDAWYFKPVQWAVENGYTSGMGDGIFGVGQSCTRAQAMTFLWASKGRQDPSSTESPFSDVTSGDWFCKPILWAAEHGVTSGIGDGLFGVSNTCTRAQIVTFLWAAEGRP